MKRRIKPNGKTLTNEQWQTTFERLRVPHDFRCKGLQKGMVPPSIFDGTRTLRVVPDRLETIGPRKLYLVLITEQYCVDLLSTIKLFAFCLSHLPA